MCLMCSLALPFRVHSHRDILRRLPFPCCCSQIITAHELYAVLRKLDPTATIEAAEAMIAEVDVDGDQEIHFEEYAPARIILISSQALLARGSSRCDLTSY